MLPAAAIFLVALLIVGVISFGTWIAFSIAIVLTLAGVFAVTRYVQRVAWTRKSGEHLNDGLAGMNKDLAVTDEAHEDISPHDLPPGSPAQREVVKRINEQQSKLPPEQRSAAPTYTPWSHAW